jgi:hypothetical protein
MSRSRVSIVAATVCLVVLIFGGVSGAQERSVNLSLTLELSQRAELADVLAARLTTPDGAPIGEARIRFWVRTQLVGERYAFAGEAPTDSSGVARLPFLPHKDSYDVRVTFDGDEEWDSAEAIVPIEFPRATRYSESDSQPLGSLRFVMPRVMGIVLSLFWTMLIGLAVWTIRSFRRSGTEDEVLKD